VFFIFHPVHLNHDGRPVERDAHVWKVNELAAGRPWRHGLASFRIDGYPVFLPLVANAITHRRFATFKRGGKPEVFGFGCVN